MYPAVVGVALVIIGYIMFAFVLPKLTETFRDFDAELPLLTVMIIKVVDVFAHYAILILFILVGLVSLFIFWRKTATGQLFVHKIYLMIPIIKNLAKKLNLARFTIIFSGLLKSGMPIVDALKITSQTMTNVYYRGALAETAEKVQMGVDLAVALEAYPKLFTPMVTQMIQVGEESGTMEKVLEEVANFYEAEIDDSVKNLSSIIEPVLVIIIGGIVGILAVGLILPIYNVGQNI
jgi:type IV pilus assembly protein PilC